MNERGRKIADSLSDIKQSLFNNTSLHLPGTSVPAQHDKKPNIGNLESHISTVVDQHEDILNHLTRQVNCYKESLSALRGRCEVLVSQNQALHKELEQHINLDVTELVNQAGDCESDVLGGESGISKANLLEQLIDVRGIYEQQIKTLERQVSLLTSELKDAECQISNLKSSGRTSTTSNLCIKCKSRDTTFMSETEVSTVTRLEKENEELGTALAQLKCMVEIMQRREDEAMNKVKKSVEIVDKVKGDQETLELKLKRSTDELNRVRERHAVQITQAKAELQQHHEEAMAEMKDNVHAKELALSESVSEVQRLQLQLESAEREHKDLHETIVRYREQGISSLEVVDKTSQQLRDQLRSALQERDEAISAMAMNKNNVQLELHDRQREVEQLQNEVSRLKQRHEASEDQARRLTLESASLHDEIANLKISSNKVNNEKLSLEKTSSLTIEHLKLVSSQTQEQAKNEIEELRSRHGETIAQLHTLLQQQQNLANKWRVAHSDSTKQFEDSSVLMADEVTKLKKEYHSFKQKNESLESKIKSMTSKNKSLKENERKMHKSLKLAESHIIKTAEELYNVVQKKNSLLRERQVMMKEISMLQSQLCDKPQLFAKVFSDHEPELDS